MIIQKESKRTKSKKPTTIIESENTEDYSHVIPEDINMGEIYKATSKTSGKSYIGQAQCYTMKDGKYIIWGSYKRWNTHIYESRSGKDHSVVLNAAIRKYGEDDFDIAVIFKGDMKTSLEDKYNMALECYNNIQKKKK